MDDGKGSSAREAVLAKAREEFSKIETFERFPMSIRVQHIVLFTTVFLLVLTGFPMKFPEIKQLNVILFLTGGVGGARIIHRVAASLLILDFLYHHLYFFNRLVRRTMGLGDLSLMLPCPQDLKDLFGNLAYFTGFKPERPRFGRFNYIEKFEYLAVYWGTLVMGLTGCVLWFPEFVTRYVGVDIIRVSYIIHSNEALLAFLSIIIWHMYNVHLNPSHFPMNKLWYTGTLTQEEMLEEHPLEYERLMAKREHEALKGLS